MHVFIAVILTLIFFNLCVVTVLLRRATGTFASDPARWTDTEREALRRKFDAASLYGKFLETPQQTTPFTEPERRYLKSHFGSVFEALEPQLDPLIRARLKEIAVREAPKDVNHP